MENKEESFSYTYSAAQQAEVEKIRKKYAQPQEDKMEQLRRLDRSASKKAGAWSIALGVVGALLLGTGMSLIMTDLDQILGDHQAWAMPAGIFIGLLGMILVALAYPVYMQIMKKEQERIAPQILRLTEELMQ